MLTRTELRNIARGRLRDAETLLQSRRYDGAIYLCGYAVEIALKARICRSLGWSGYPSTNRDFQNYQSFRTHDLDTLLHLSGLEARIKQHYLAEWSAVATWEPEVRYRPIGNASVRAARSMVDAARILLRIL